MPKDDRKRDQDASSSSTSDVGTSRPAAPLQHQSQWSSFTLPVALLSLGAFSAIIVQLNLSPAYGSIASVIYHREAVCMTALLALVLKWARGARALPNDLSVILPYVPVHSCLLPAVLHFGFLSRSSDLGPVTGPVTVEIVTSLPLILVACYATLNLSYYGRNLPIDTRIIDILVAAASCGFIWALEVGAKVILPSLLGSNFFMTRTGLLILLACNYGIRFPSKLLLIGIPCLFFALQMNPHSQLAAPTRALNETLQEYGWSLLERKDSLTGYLSVLENVEAKFRVLRCDHSLLGGVWVPSPERSTVAEPIYSVFTVLEAVRLMVLDENKNMPVGDIAKTALVIGLGIGTCPKALAAQGITTNVIEIDQNVHILAKKYFDFPENIPVVHADASQLVNNAMIQSNLSYDYIVHDVFTGGGEPLELFNYEFLSDLHSLLKENGTIAINYAGDLELPKTALIFNTVASVFQRCRIFRDGPPEEGEEAKFMNIIVFCSKRDTPWSFRGPMDEDFMGSLISQQNLLPSYEIDWPRMTPPAKSTDVLRKGQEHTFKSVRTEGAITHWGIMRTVLPDVVWELW